MSFLKDNEASILYVRIGEELVWSRVFDWNTPPSRPMPPEDVWTLMVAGCNAHEVAVAAGVCPSAAVGLMRRAAMLNDRSKSARHHLARVRNPGAGIG